MVMDMPTAKAKSGKKKVSPLLIVGGVGAAIVVYVAYSRAKNSSAGAGTTTDTTTDPSIDPSTGIPYADEDYSGTGAVGTTPSLYSYQDPSTGAYLTNGAITGLQTNAAWSQAAESYLTGLGYDGQTVAAALGTYLTGGGLSAAQLQIVQAAQAFQGAPPSPVAPPQLSTPEGQTQQTSSNNANLAQLRATYDTTLATLRNSSLKLSPAQISALRAQLGTQGAAYQAALAQANLAQQKS